MSRLWHRGDPLDQTIERFTVGRDPELDQRLVPYDALGSAAHAVMLASVGVIERSAIAGLLIELRRVAAEARGGSFVIRQADEDGHTALENRLTQALGEVGRRIHTGRSRNDQVIAALRLYGREAILDQATAALALADHLLELAEAHRETAVAGYTHTRQGMPSTFGLLFGAHAEALVDHLVWLRAAFDHFNRSPLGSASGYGVALPLDRELVAHLLRFDRVQVNTLAVQNDRGKGEFLALSVAAAIATDLSRLAVDLIDFSRDELGYVRLGVQVTTGSSIMPQKRNPDVLELIRATAARLRARQAEAAAVYGPLASGYHRDLQLTKEPFLEGMQACLDGLRVMRPVLASLEIDPARARGGMQRAIGATDAVYKQVAQGTPFRDAYRVVAADPEAAVLGASQEGWRDRCHLGAPGGDLGLAQCRQELRDANAWVDGKRAQLGAAWRLLEPDVDWTALCGR